MKCCQQCWGVGYELVNDDPQVRYVGFEGREEAKDWKAHPCTACDGLGKKFELADVWQDAPLQPRTRVCFTCRGRGKRGCAACGGSGSVPWQPTGPLRMAPAEPVTVCRCGRCQTLEMRDKVVSAPFNLDPALLRALTKFEPV
jgi:hypothetical protein